MSTALLGAQGQLGQALLRTLPGEVVPIPRANIDLASVETIGPTLRALRPSCVVNCAAYNLVDQAEADPASAFAVNTLGVRALANCCRELDCVLVHFSTDHVFGVEDERDTPYRETDCPGPVNVYGITKLAGEYCVRSLCRNHLVIRTCGLYGQHQSAGSKRNFVDAILHQAQTGATLRVVADQRCTPTAAADLAQAVAALLAAGQRGLFHFTNAGSCTWYEFACAILAATGSHAKIVPVCSVEHGAKALRPRASVLDCERYDRLQLVPRRPWREALHDYLAVSITR